MSFNWIDKFQHSLPKPPNYAEKTLAAYRLGMKAGGAIRGVSLSVDETACTAVKQLAPQAVYHPDEAPQVPLPGCPQGRRCRCVYRPVMAYPPEEAGEG